MEWWLQRRGGRCSTSASSSTTSRGIAHRLPKILFLSLTLLPPSLLPWLWTRLHRHPTAPRRLRWIPLLLPTLPLPVATEPSFTGILHPIIPTVASTSDGEGGGVLRSCNRIEPCLIRIHLCCRTGSPLKLQLETSR